MNARTLRRRLHQGRLGYYKSKLRHGLCHYCKNWDSVDNKALSKLWASLREELHSGRPGFFDEWDECLKKDTFVSLPEVDIMASVRFWEQLFAYITKRIKLLHRHGCEFARSFMDTFMKDEGSMSIVRGFQWHLQAWKHQDLQYEIDQEKPQANRLYLACDFADRLFFSDFPKYDTAGGSKIIMTDTAGGSKNHNELQR